MFIRYNNTGKYWEYDTSAGQTGAGPWVKLPIDYSQIYNPPTIPPPFVLPANVALTDRINQFTWNQRISNAGGDYPRLVFTNVSAGVDQKVWMFITHDSKFNFWCLNDAESSVIANLIFDRAGGISCGLVYPSGIQFQGAQVSSSNPNTLDDYEEGTWTPDFRSPDGYSVGTMTGSYIKIGSLIQVMFDITISGYNWSPSSQPSIRGLPFINNNIFAMGLIGYFLNLGANIYTLHYEVDPYNNVVFILYKNAASSFVEGSVISSFFPVNARFIGTITYRTST